MNSYKSFDFSEILENNTLDYDGPHANLIRNSRDIFDLMVSLIDESDLPQFHKSKLFSAIGYFILPKDLYPEDKHGAIGYIDDILLSIHVIKEIQEAHYPIEEYWSGGDNLNLITTTYFEIAKKEYIDLYNELIEYMGF